MDRTVNFEKVMDKERCRSLKTALIHPATTSSSDIHSSTTWRWKMNIPTDHTITSSCILFKGWLLHFGSSWIARVAKILLYFAVCSLFAWSSILAIPSNGFRESITGQRHGAKEKASGGIMDWLRNSGSSYSAQECNDRLAEKVLRP